jgi:glycosyltransferase involved in cell wall biosynthesis
VERVLTTKVNYLASLGDRYAVTVILTDGRGRSPYYPLADSVEVINLDIGFEELWTMPFWRKVLAYLRKQRRYKRLLTAELMRLRPDITVSTLRREINFLCDIADGSRKVGELHVNRHNYRNFESVDSNPLKRLFAWFWMRSLVGKLRRLDRFVVLTGQDRLSWPELSHVSVIPNPLPSLPVTYSPLTARRIVAVGRYVYQKGFDLLLQAWQRVEAECTEWRLDVFGPGDRAPYLDLMDELQLDSSRCALHGPREDIAAEYLRSSIFVFSSRFEGFGMVLLEAMAHGLAVVSFDCPCGPSDIVSDGSDGLLVANGDVEQLARSIIRLIRNREERETLAAAAIEKARSYDISVIGRQWTQLFDELSAH